MAKKISDHSSSSPQGDDHVAIYRESASTSDLRAPVSLLPSAAGFRGGYDVGTVSGPLSLDDFTIDIFGTTAAPLVLTMPTPDNPTVIDQLRRIVTSGNWNDSVTLKDDAGTPNTIKALQPNVVYHIRWRGTSATPRWNIESLTPRTAGTTSQVVLGDGTLSTLSTTFNDVQGSTSANYTVTPYQFGLNGAQQNEYLFVNTTVVGTHVFEFTHANLAANAFGAIKKNTSTTGVVTVLVGDNTGGSEVTLRFGIETIAAGTQRAFYGEVSWVYDAVSRVVHVSGSVVGDLDFGGSAVSGVIAKEDDESGGFTLAVADAGKQLSCTGSFTIVISSAATYPDGYRATIANTGTGTITLDGPGTTNPTIAANQVREVMKIGGKLYRTAAVALEEFV